MALAHRPSHGTKAEDHQRRHRHHARSRSRHQTESHRLAPSVGGEVDRVETKSRWIFANCQERPIHGKAVRTGAAA